MCVNATPPVYSAPSGIRTSGIRPPLLCDLKYYDGMLSLYNRLPVYDYPLYPTSDPYIKTVYDHWKPQSWSDCLLLQSISPIDRSWMANDVNVANFSLSTSSVSVKIVCFFSVGFWARFSQPIHMCKNRKWCREKERSWHLFIWLDSLIRPLHYTTIFF